MSDKNEATGPLKGLRVLEVGVLLAGPVCGQILGDMGADVVKVEPPGQPDPLRQWGAVKPDGVSVWFGIVGRNKRCINLDLRTQDGQDTFKALADTADIIVENFRPGTLEKWGLGYDTLSSTNPGLILVRVSGYGQSGPKKNEAGYASVGEAFGGLRYVMGEPDRPPSRAGISLGDTLAAMNGAIGALAALEHRRNTGQGQIVDSAIYEACFSMMESLVPDYQFGQRIRERTGSYLPGVAPSNIYPANDGMMIIAANQDTVWKRLCEAMGAPELASDDRFSNHESRGANQKELDNLISSWSEQHSCQDLEALCEANGVPCSRLYTAEHMLEDSHYAAREAIVDVEHPELGSLKMPNVFPKLSQTPGNIRWPAHEPGSDTDSVLRDWLSRPSK